jgi:serine protease AprX
VTSQIFRRFLGVALTLTLSAFLYSAMGAAALSPTLKAKLPTLSSAQSVGVVIVAFNTPKSGLSLTNIALLKSVGITNAVTFQKLGMVATVATAGQIRALQSNNSVKSIWSNDQLAYYLNHAREITGVDRLRSNPEFMAMNQGMRVSGGGDFSVMLIDSGIDSTHADLPAGSKVVQNTMRVIATTDANVLTVGGVPVAGFIPGQSIENVPNTDNVGHGTHCAGIIGGIGARSDGLYAGVAPGAKIVGSGGGVVILVLSALEGWEYALSHADLYRIRVVSNSYGPISTQPFDPNDPIMIAAKKAHDDYNMTVAFAADNKGPGKGTMSSYAQAPWVIGVAAGTKDGMLADFSSRGIPKEERLSDNDPSNDLMAPTLTAPGAGRFFETSLAEYGFTADIQSVRSSTGLTNALNLGDTEVPANYLPFYTSESGTSMATPFVAGTVALMLDADPTLTPDEIKQILIDTATRMPGYQEFEVGAGYLNAYAAVDKVFHRSKAFKNFSEPTFNARFTEERPPVQEYTVDYDPSVSGAGSANSREFTVADGMSVLDVWGNVDAIAEAGTGNFVGMSVYDPTGKRYGATSIPTPVIGTGVREVIVNNPVAGTWRVEFRGACGLAATPGVCSPQQLAAPGPAQLRISQVKYVLPNIADLSESTPGYDGIVFALKNRLIDTYPDGTFHPEQTVTREDLARTLMIDAPVRQSIGNTPKFADVSGDLARIAEAVTSSGSTFRDVGFTSTGAMAASGTNFNPAAPISRLDLAVALVKSLGHDAKARALAGTTVTTKDGSTPLIDSDQIPAELRGYVQIAIQDGMFEAFPAEIRQIGPGQFQAVPGPRFEPASGLTRGQFAAKLASYYTLFWSGL